jgi:tetratricopeptide (TPR) repeat protein
VRCTLILLAALAWPSVTHAADARWTMLQTPTMTVMGNQPGDVLRDVAIQIEQFRRVVGGLIPRADRPPSVPTIVFVFGDKKSMLPFVPVSNGKPADVSGYFQRSADANHIALSLEDPEESAAVVYHEYTHLLVANAVRSVPVWLNEGLAEYYGSYTLARDGRSAEIGRMLDWRLALLRARWLPLEEVLKVDTSVALHGANERRSLFYSEAWILTHYLLAQVPDGGAKINRYVAALADGQPPATAFYQAFGATPVEMDKQLRTYVRQQQFTAMRYTFKERLDVAPPGPPREMTAGEADAWLGDLQRRIGRRAEGTARIETAAQRNPDTAAAQLALGLLRASDDSPEAIEILNRAQALAPGDFATQFLHGVALLRVDRGFGVHTQEAAASLRRAVAMRSDSADAHGWLAFALMMSDDHLVDAQVEILRAIELAPGRLEYRLRYADISILQGRIADARAMLNAIAAVTFDVDAANAARTRLATLDEPPAGSSGASRSIPTPAIDPNATSTDTLVRLRLRVIQPGEERTRGHLTRIVCDTKGIRFELDAAGTPLVASARQMKEVDLIAYLSDKEFLIGCGVRTPPDHVYLTWRLEGTTRVAVAVEFLPADYVP